MVSRTWFYTLNNYTEQEVIQFKSFLCKKHRCTKEVGEGGTPHLQGQITWNKTYRLAGLKKMNPRAKWMITESEDHAINYCTKGEIIVDLNNSQQGTRNDLLDIGKRLVAGEDIKQVAGDRPDMYIKYHAGMTKLWNMFQEDPDDKIYDTKVYIYWGKPGTGKSYCARHKFKSIYRVPKTGKADSAVWFDGYRGQKTILFEEFYGNISYEMMLDFCDIYPMQVPVKGGFGHRKWENIIFTSNKHPNEWWTFEDNTDAFKRRITDITLFTEAGNVTVTEVK